MTPVGWAKAHMLYDLAEGPPEPGSLLESILTIVAKRRQEQAFIQTKLLVEAFIAPHTEGGSTNLSKTFELYKNSAFPFLAGERAKELKQSKQLLEHWTKKVFRVKPLWRAKENMGIVSKLRRGADQVKKAEDLRRQVRHTRI